MSTSGHVATDGVARIAEHGGGHGALVGVQAAHQAFGDRGGQLVEQGGAVVGVKVADDVGDLLSAQRGDQLGLVVGGQRLEDGQRTGLAEHPEQQGGLGGGAGLHEVDELCGGQGLRFEGELLEVGLVLRLTAQEGQDGVDGGARGGHGTILSDRPLSGPRRCSEGPGQIQCHA